MNIKLYTNPTTYPSVSLLITSHCLEVKWLFDSKIFWMIVILSCLVGNVTYIRFWNLLNSASSRRSGRLVVAITVVVILVLFISTKSCCNNTFEFEFCFSLWVHRPSISSRKIIVLLVVYFKIFAIFYLVIAETIC